MKYSTAIKNALILLSVVLPNSIGLVSHASAATMPAHEMSHNTSYKANQERPLVCMALCTTAPLKDERGTGITAKEQDDQPVPFASQPYFALYQRHYAPRRITKSQLQHRVFRPPDLFKLHANYRF